MEISKVPYTLNYELRKLKERLQEVDQFIQEFQSDNPNVFDIRWIKCRYEKEQIQEEIQAIEELFSLDPSDPNSIA